jgi:hypothetical protein
VDLKRERRQGRNIWDERRREKDEGKKKSEP